MNKQEEKETIELLHHTNTAMSFITKGKVYLEFDEKNSAVKMVGDKKDVEALNKNLVEPNKTDNPQKHLPAFFEHFNWNYDYDKKEKTLGGEGVIAYMLFQILMGGLTDTKTINEFFSKIQISIVNN